MPFWKIFLFLFVFLLHLPALTYAQNIESIKIAITKKLFDRYQKFLSDNQIDVLTVKNLALEKVTRGVAHLIIIKQALHKGGLDVEFEFVFIPNTQRARAFISNGGVVLSPYLGRKEEQPKDSFISSVIVKPRVLTKGIYGLASNKALMSVKSFEDLKAYKGVLVSTWTSDVQTLEKHGITQFELVPHHKNIFIRIAYRGLDYTILDFPRRDSLIKFHGEVELFPIPNISIESIGARYFFISRKHPDGKFIYQALEKGLKLMKSNGTINEYFRQIKVIRDDLDSFKPIN